MEGWRKEQLVVCETAIPRGEKPSFTASARQLMIDRLTLGHQKPPIQLTGHELASGEGGGGVGINEIQDYRSGIMRPPVSRFAD